MMQKRGMQDTRFGHPNHEIIRKVECKTVFISLVLTVHDDLYGEGELGQALAQVPVVLGEQALVWNGEWSRSIRRQ